jgi:hypothetical protein
MLAGFRDIHGESITTLRPVSFHPQYSYSRHKIPFFATTTYTYAKPSPHQLTGYNDVP